MSIQMMRTLSNAALVGAGVFGVLTIFLWFYLDIKGVIADLRGLKVKIERRPAYTAPKTEMLEEQTSALASEVTALLNGYRLELNEMVVHTEERV